MHNSQVLMGPALRRGGTPQVAVMHAGDAERAGIADGDLIRITSAAGAIEIPVSITEDIVGGVVAVPHGFGHGGTGGWRLANRVGGVNVNRLNSTDIADIEPLAGMSRLSGVPVRVEPA